MSYKTYGLSFPELAELGFTNREVVEDGGYVYFAYAEPGTLTAEARWAVKRINSTTGSIEWAGKSNDQIHKADDMPGLFS